MPLPTDQPIGEAQPIMLRDAARLMFPDGSVNEKTLRRMRDQGKLDCSRIRCRDYTTIAAMRAMLERTRVKPKASAAAAERQDGRSARAAALVAIARLREPPSKPKKKPRPR